jgi:hypothetical protein
MLAKNMIDTNYSELIENKTYAQKIRTLVECFISLLLWAVPIFFVFDVVFSGLDFALQYNDLEICDDTAILNDMLAINYVIIIMTSLSLLFFTIVLACRIVDINKFEGLAIGTEIGCCLVTAIPCAIFFHMMVSTSCDNYFGNMPEIGILFIIYSVKSWIIFCSVIFACLFYLVSSIKCPITR